MTAVGYSLVIPFLPGTFIHDLVPTIHGLLHPQGTYVIPHGPHFTFDDRFYAWVHFFMRHAIAIRFEDFCHLVLQAGDHPYRHHTERQREDERARGRRHGGKALVPYRKPHRGCWVVAVRYGVGNKSRTAYGRLCRVVANVFDL